MTEIRARSVGFGRDVGTIAARAVRLLPRDLEGVVPPLVAAVFVLVVTIGSLQDLAGFADIGIDYKEFQLPTAVIFGVTGMSRAYALVLDIQGGYFDRMLMSPVSRLAILLGLMVADVLLVGVVSALILAMGLVLGAWPDTGLLGALVFVGLSSLWGLAFAGFPYALALRTGNPAAVAGSWVLSFPFILLTTAFVPRDAMTDWLSAVAAWNPATYLLEGQRSLFTDWDAGAIAEALAGIAVLAAVSMPIAFLALRGRTRRG